MDLKYNKITFQAREMISLRKIIYIGILILISVFIMTLVLTLSSNGFNDYENIFRINKNLLVVIPIASASLAISSLILQQLSKNRLADNSILGLGNVNLLALMILIFMLDFDSDYSVNRYKNVYPFVFIIVSVLACLFIYLISFKRNQNISKKFIIVGIILNFTFISLTVSLNGFLPPGKSAAVKQFFNGFIDSASELSMYVAIIFFILATIWLFFIYEKFRVCATNYTLARSLGINASAINLQALLITGILSGVAYILVGNISFLGFLAGNMAYAIFKKSYNYTFPAACLIGIIIMGFT
ncbi:MAG: iron ABC transporter permease, partial [Mycoplasmoidaceae bacterium]